MEMKEKNIDLKDVAKIDRKTFSRVVPLLEFLAGNEYIKKIDYLHSKHYGGLIETVREAAKEGVKNEEFYSKAIDYCHCLLDLKEIVSLALKMGIKNEQFYSKAVYSAFNGWWWVSAVEMLNKVSKEGIKLQITTDELCNKMIDKLTSPEGSSLATGIVYDAIRLGVKNEQLFVKGIELLYKENRIDTISEIATYLSSCETKTSK